MPALKVWVECNQEESPQITGGIEQCLSRRVSRQESDVVSVEHGWR